MGQKSAVAVVLDAGAIIAFERGDARMRELCREALRTGIRLVVPAGVVGQVFGDGRRQVGLRALLKGRTTEVPALDQPLAEACGVMHRGSAVSVRRAPGTAHYGGEAQCP